MGKPLDPARLLQARMEASAATLVTLREAAAGDEDFLTDLIEGETDLFDIIAKLDASEHEDGILIVGMSDAIAKLKARKEAAEKRAETKRTIIAVALDQIGIKTHRTPLGTISISPKHPTALVTEEADIPARFWKSAAPTLDKAELNRVVNERRVAMEEAAKVEDQDERRRALEVAEAAHPPIPGTTLSNGGIKVSIRRR